ncbi:MAG: VOC family protein [Pseudomonadota bacterium]
MHLLKAATLSVSNLDRSVALYSGWLDYTTVEKGTVTDDLAAAWGAPAAAGRRTAVMAPASGADIFIRFVEADPVATFKPLTTYGWAAIEICVRDVLSVASRMERSPFKIIGPPREIEGLDAIYPMQVMGPDGEVVYLTQIRSNLPAYRLPRAKSMIDHLFILVLGCSDMRASIKWFEDAVGLGLGRVMDIEYTMLAKAFGTPLDELHTISTVIHDKDVFLELDQLPDVAGPRPGPKDALPPGVAMATLKAPDFDAIAGDWAAPPAARDGAIYGGGRSGTLIAPDGTRVEIVETH